MTQQSRLTMQFIVGLDMYGEEITRDKRFSNIKGSATDAALETVALTLTSLQKHNLLQVVRINNYTLI
ncbi:DUF1659 domain-containing protein [Bacillus sp. FJAT-45037]|uniref:DUF1659 domain-containing protein n=1 Tax=Bacillus sp. FJAT-45037 TaxID=2011007 RepID=UPI0012FD0953|nr:DUF1659 domain-containing protein [Bacillus sp. FJAT-45037]